MEDQDSALTEVLLQMLDQVDGLQEQCAEGLIRVDELRKGLNEIEAKMLAKLPPDSRASRVFDRDKRQIDQWWSESPSGYAQPDHCRKVASWRALLNAVLKEVDPAGQVLEAGHRTRFFIQAGEGYRATSVILKIMRRADEKLLIADPYLDAVIFDYLDELAPEVGVRLITANKKAMFVRQFQQRPILAGTCQARECDEFHDRFIAVDGQEIWHLGASINHIGAKATLVSRIVEKQEAGMLLAKVEQWWASGTPL